MRVGLSAHHHAAICGRDLVILDESAGTYGMVAGAVGHTQIGVGGRSLITTDQALLEDLMTSGALAPPSCLPVVNIELRAPVRSALDEAESPQSFINGLHVGRAWADMVTDYYGRSFSHIIRTARKGQRREGRSVNLNSIEQLAKAFEAWSPWIPFQGDCFFRCFMLLRVIQRAGYDCHWAFGVKTWPFYAHCWLQAEDVALTDYAEVLTPFTPILTV